MGLFDKFRGRDDVRLSPFLVLIISLVYCQAADGEIDDEEVAFLITALGGQSDEKAGVIGIAGDKRTLLDQALKYVRRTSVDNFLREAPPMLSYQQKLCILCNMADSSLADGDAEAEEQELISKFQQAFGVSDDAMRPIIETVILKNDKSIFF